jgi:enamine deaminase RidA (YjgF/YER057c/UK114 family)
MSPIRRLGTSRRWADVVIHGETAYWVEVADDLSLDTHGQIAEVLQQIDATLLAIGSDRTRILQVLIHLADLSDGAILDRLWDAWVPEGHPPVRARFQSALGGNCRVEMVVTAAVDAETSS